jgi:glycosyltransferase involved in cell wall biosynthesis
VIALEDSGGTRELIEDGVNGLIVPPDPKALGEKFDALYEKKSLAQQLGESGFAELTSRDLDWNAIIARLLA